MIIRPATASDLGILQDIATAMKAHHEPGYFQRCLAERRSLFLALDGTLGLGYAQVNWQPVYLPFRRLNIPELVDLNVVPDAQRQGLGAKLVEICEEAARDRGCPDMGISVGVHAGFGAAQRLYARLGYVPDGAGVTYDDVVVTPGDIRAVDDLLTLKLVRKL